MIQRNAKCNYLFDYIENNQVILTGVSFETIQNYLGIESENFAGYDDNRYMLFI